MGIGGDELHEEEHARVVVQVHAEVVDRANRVLECASAVGDGDDARDCRICLLEGGFDVVGDAVLCECKAGEDDEG